MKKENLVKIFYIGTFFFLLLFLIWIISRIYGLSSSEAKVVYLDVGQGDATLIELPGDRRILIDAGPGTNVLKPLSHEIPFGALEIDTILLTHFDADHIGGVPEILRRYKVGQILITGETNKVAVFNEIAALAKEKNVMIKRISAGDYLESGNSTFQIIFPNSDTTGWEENSMSAISKLNSSNYSFLFTGDAPKAVENYLTSIYGAGLQSDVLKAGHHGSKNSSSDIFLAAVASKYDVISAGLNNRYGHPNKEVIDSLNKLGENILETFKSGSISFEVQDGILKVNK